jgi:hypothetical protein
MVEKITKDEIFVGWITSNGLRDLLLYKRQNRISGQDILKVSKIQNCVTLVDEN